MVRACESGDAGGFFARLGAVPTVYAFVDEWDPASETSSDIDTIRAELRDLGALLVVFSRTVVMSFRPGDGVDGFTPRGPAIDAEALVVARRYGVEAASAPFVPSVVIVDARGRVRFRYVGQAGAQTLRPMLARALRAGSRSFAGSSRPPAWITRRDWTLTCLVSGFAAVFAGACERASPSARARPSVRRPDAGTNVT
ncbi:MAG: hypothetical protein FWD17_13900 [Polyangiaceae bacterium]|nr:hypothetical protein [Polyangiaceae bacterium]